MTKTISQRWSFFVELTKTVNIVICTCLPVGRLAKQTIQKAKEISDENQLNKNTLLLLWFRQL